MTKKEKVNKQETYQYWLSAEVIAPYIEQAKTQLKQQQAEALAQKKAIEQAAKEATLSKVYTQRDHVWQQAQVQANRACASGYDQASRDLHQLAEAYQFKGEGAEFEGCFKRFIANNNGRKALLNRLQGLL